MKSFYILTVLIIFLFSFSLSKAKDKKPMKMKISSSSFQEGTLIPQKFTCDGKNISPALEWQNVPKGTKSFALIVDDPDAPMGTWIHWVVYNIPSDVLEFPEDFSSSELNNKVKQGSASNNKTGYHGPCPPNGTHRYFFKIYALDLVLEEEPGLTKEKILKKMEGHILGQGELMGKYHH
ncbi:MAG: YbhB/YbcL family Raf kinase inhibitor-like protein [Bacteroidota bacterium]